MTLIYWDALREKVDELDIDQAYSADFMTNPELNPADLIGEDRLIELSVNRRDVNMALLSTRRALLKRLIKDFDPKKPA